MSSKSIIMVTPWVKFVRKAKGEGFNCISIWKKEKGAEDLLQQIVNLSDETYIFDITNFSKLEEVICATLKSAAIDYIFHAGREDTMLETYKIAEKYGKSLNSSKSIMYINNKLKMRELLLQFNLSPVRHISVKDLEHVDEVSIDFGFPFIIKPENMSGSRGVYLCYSFEDIEAFKLNLNNYNYEGPFIIEEYLEGSEVSVEVLSQKGIHHVLGITDKIKGAPPYFVEMGHVHPSQLSEEAKLSISKLVVDYLNLTGFKFGPTHTEVILTKNGPRIVESQARLGGDQIPYLVNLATGTDMESAIFELLNDKSLVLQKNDKVASITYFSLPLGEVKEITGLNEIKSLPYVKSISLPFQEGDKITQIKDSKSRHGYFIIAGDTHEEVEQSKNVVNSLLKVLIKTNNL